MSAALTLPARLNGFPIVRARDHGNGFATVLVERAPEDFAVATWWPALGTCWQWGHYSRNAADAAADFAEVAGRNVKRESVA